MSMIKKVDKLIKQVREQGGDSDTIVFSETAWEIFKEEMTKKLIKEGSPLVNTDDLVTPDMKYMGLFLDIDPAIEDGKVYIIKSKVSSFPARKIGPPLPFYLISFTELQLTYFHSFKQGNHDDIPMPEGTVFVKHWYLWGNC